MSSNPSGGSSGRAWQLFLAVVGAALSALFAVLLGSLGNGGDSTVINQWQIDEGLVSILKVLGTLVGVILVIAIFGKILKIFGASDTASDISDLL